MTHLPNNLKADALLSDSVPSKYQCGFTKMKHDTTQERRDIPQMCQRASNSFNLLIYN